MAQPDLPLSALPLLSAAELYGPCGTEYRAVQAAWVDLGVPQCGYCQAGQIMSATALLKTNPNPSDEQIEEAMVGNICRCGTYNRIKTAIRQASTHLKEAKA